MIFRKRGGCWKGGCSGCAVGLVVLVALPLLALVLFLVVGSHEPRPDRTTLTFPLPSVPEALPEGALEAGPEGALEAGPEALPQAGPEPGPGMPPLALFLDLSMGSFTLEPGPPGSELTVVADFDAAAYEIVEERGTDELRYALRFGSRGGWLGALRSRGGDLNEVHITVPRGYPVALSGNVRMGESRLDAGGLWLTEVDLDLGAGSHLLAFSEPLTGAADWVEVKGSMGEMEVERLGNASPRRARFEHSFGSFRLDLEGAWKQKADIVAECGFGECRVLRPENVPVVLERTAVNFGEKTVAGGPGLTPEEEELPDEAPVIHLWMSTDAGDLRVD